MSARAGPSAAASRPDRRARPRSRRDRRASSPARGPMPRHRPRSGPSGRRRPRSGTARPGHGARAHASRRSASRCQSGASPVSIQVSPRMRVAERLDRLVRPLRRLPCPHDPLPAQPADRRIERRQVIADACRIGGDGGRPPFARLQHRRLVVLGDRLSRSPRSDIPPSPGWPFSPAQPLELQPLHLAAMRARHEEPPLVARLELPLDPAQAPDRRRRDQEHLAPMGEGQRPRLGQRDRVAFLVGRGRIGVDLVEEDVARRRRAQPDRRVRARS